jgi:hypothetical protein
MHKVIVQGYQHIWFHNVSVHTVRATLPHEMRYRVVELLMRRI